jgi:prepilin signal peptidase PulO-like enzyme (type II secretory pathway)
MDFTQLTQYFVVVVLVACLIVGYILKTSFDKLPNKYIPTILAVVGAVLNVFVGGLSVESVVYGALMGLASTGLHQAFTRFVEGEREDA